jgi:hypothetical protein
MNSFAASLVALVALASAVATAAPADPPAASPETDFSALLDLGTHAMKPVVPKKDPKTGFVVGGKNETALIRALTELNGRPIADLEKDMRPGAPGQVGSTAGFLGKDESLLDVLAADNAFVVETQGLTHQELAKHLHAMGQIAWWQMKYKCEKKVFLYHGRRFQVEAICWKGYQYSPFKDGTKTDCDVTVKNLDTGKEFGYSMLMPELVARYGFYEGSGTSYRVDPRTVLDVFDFLQAGEITPRGKKLGQFLDAMNVEGLWRAGDLVEWETGKTIKTATDDKPHTHCSAFVAAVCKKMNVYFLHPPEHSTVMLANAQADWLPLEGAKWGWKPVESAVLAQRLANDGRLVVAAYREPGDQKSGHIAVMRPAAKSIEELAAEGPQIIQAGMKNHNSTTLKTGFCAHPGAWDKGGIKYYQHD